MILRKPDVTGEAAPPEPAAPAPAPSDQNLQLPQGHTDDVFGDDDSGDFDPASMYEATPAAAPAPAAQPPVVAPAQPAPASAGGAAPQATPAQPAAVPGATPPAQPVVAPAAQPAAQPAAPTAAAPAPAQPQTIEGVSQAYQEHRSARISELATKTFALSDDQAQLLETNPREAVPQLMAAATMAAIEATTVAIANMLPQVVEHITSSRRDQTAAEDEFFTAWPKLKEHRSNPVVEQIGQLWRQVNPQGTKEQFMAAVGPACMAALNLPFDTPQAPAQPQAPRIPPHQPPRGGAPARAPQPSGNDNIFTLMADDDLANA